MKIKLHMEMLMAAAAMVTAVAAVVVAVIQTDIMREEAEMEREHARLSVQPSLWIFQNTNTDETTGNYSVLLLNKGLGPAVIEHFEVELDGKVLMQWNDVVEAISDNKFHLRGEDRNVRSVGYSAVPPGHIIPAGETVTPIRFTDVDLALLQLLNNPKTRPTYRACVCSIYKECWKTIGMGSRPTPVKQCVADQSRHFRGS